MTMTVGFTVARALLRAASPLLGTLFLFAHRPKSTPTT